PGKGCARPWIAIAPRGWVCGEFLAPSKKAPYGQDVPQLDRGEIVPGTYGKVTAPGATTYTLDKKRKDKKPKKDDDSRKMIEDKPIIGSLNVREYDELTIGGKVYWKVSQKDSEYVLKSTVTRHVPSGFAGERLG